MKCWGPPKCTFGFSGSSCASGGGSTRPGRPGSHTMTHRTPYVHFGRPQHYKHHRNYTSRRPERAQRVTFYAGGRKTKREILGPPPFWGSLPPFWASHHPSGLSHPSGPLSLPFGPQLLFCPLLAATSLFAAAFAAVFGVFVAAFAAAFVAAFPVAAACVPVAAACCCCCCLCCCFSGRPLKNHPCRFRPCKMSRTIFQLISSL